MQRAALFIISGNPLTDPRPAEALRIAAGVGAWQKSCVRVYLHHSTVDALTHHPGELRDGHQFQPCLTALATPEQPVLVPVGTASGLAPETTMPHLQEITEPELASLAAQCQCVLHF